MAVTTRREEHKALTRQAVLDAAAAQFADPGYGASSIDAIGRAARVSKGAVYHHFADKAALFEATLRDRETRLLDTIVRRAERRRDAWGRLDAVLAAYVAGLIDDPVHRALLAQAPAALGPPACRALDGELGLAVLSETLGALRQADRVRGAPGELLTARVLLAAAREAAIVAGSAPDRAEGRGEAQSVLAAFTLGLRTPPGRRVGP